jgi:hypothetical protein
MSANPLSGPWARHKAARIAAEAGRTAEAEARTGAAVEAADNRPLGDRRAAADTAGERWALHLPVRRKEFLWASADGSPDSIQAAPDRPEAAERAARTSAAVAAADNPPAVDTRAEAADSRQAAGKPGAVDRPAAERGVAEVPPPEPPNNAGIPNTTEALPSHTSGRSS